MSLSTLKWRIESYGLKRKRPDYNIDDVRASIEMDEGGIDELKELSENENTKKSTEQWKNVFVKWATERRKEKNLETYEFVDLDKSFSQFYAEVRKESGEDYEPDSLRVMQAALERHLKSKLYPKSIIKDTEFLSSRKVLEGKARKLREEGRGKTSQPIQKPFKQTKKKKPFGKVVSLAVEIPEHLSTRCGGW
ncbi:hypothetical protein AWC38_SpisGene25512 [Stylophora pistillata]|uniref:QRICH1-like domain-containing protein n=1 Tax=Stylophora pistillata TaxID=50429 RepID=A0A2B4R421_STYPI|nr:hypothetical protein AWC38_SpisGene25512 [Stylophora pistillata]